MPPKREPPSRNSTASFSPVEAPDGTSDLDLVPSERKALTSTVGLSRESNTSLAITFSMDTDIFLPPEQKKSKN